MRQFILSHHRAIAFCPAMTSGTRTAGDAFKYRTTSGLNRGQGEQPGQEGQ